MCVRVVEQEEEEEGGGGGGEEEGVLPVRRYKSRCQPGSEQQVTQVKPPTHRCCRCVHRHHRSVREATRARRLSNYLVKDNVCVCVSVCDALHRVDFYSDDLGQSFLLHLRF